MPFTNRTATLSLNSDKEYTQKNIPELDGALILVDSTSQAIEITLPLMGKNEDGFTLTVKHILGLNEITIQSAAQQLLDGAVGAAYLKQVGSSLTLKWSQNSNSWYTEQQTTVSFTTSSLYVDVAAPDGGDGSREKPFIRIQDALDLIETRLDASSTNRYLIKIGPGLYPENLIRRSPYVSLIGAGTDTTIIKPSDGPTLTITNATKESLALFLTETSNNMANFDAEYSTLVPDSGLTFPDSIMSPIAGEVTNLTLGSTGNSPDKCSTLIINAGADSEAVYVDRTFRRCNFDSSIYIRNITSVVITDCSAPRSQTLIRQARSVSFSKSLMRSVEADFNLTDDRPATPHDTASFIADRLGEYILGFTLKGATIGAFKQSILKDLTISGANKPIAIQLQGNCTIDDLNVSSDSTVNINGGQIENNVITSSEDTLHPTVNMYGVVIQGDVTLNQTAGSFTLFGGGYLGILTDTNGVYTGTALTL